MMQEIEQWLEMAKMDFGVAKHLFETYFPKPYEIICYHCQQAAEKVIKAVIIFDGAQGGLPKSHDLSFLLNQIKNRVNIAEEIYNHADALTPYGIAVRYPSELYLEEKHAKEALRMTQEMITWGENVLAPKTEE